jgi:hypothetical protein
MTGTQTTPGTGTADTFLAEVVDTWMKAWNEADPDRRRDLVRRSWTPDGRYADPFLEAGGAGAIADSLGQLRDQFPGYSVRRASGIEPHFGWVRFAWELLAPDGEIVTDGVDVGELAADGRFRNLVGFVGQTVAVPLR